jgi:succinate dehydrogenase hydrophobic anchor subunit
MTDAPKLSGSQVTAAACVAVIVPGLGAWVGAHTGTKGTVIGTAIGAVLSVLCGWAVLRLTYHARSGLAKVPWDRTRPWHLAVAAAAVFVVAMVAVTGAEAGVFHRSLSAEVSGSRAGGTTFGSVVGVHAPASDPPRPAATVLGPSGTISASASPAPATVGGTPGPPSSPMTPDPSTSTNAPPTGAASPVPAQQPGGSP